MKKPDQSERYLKDWDTDDTSKWMEIAEQMQNNHCRSRNANEKGVRFKKDLFYKMDDLILSYAFGGAAKKGGPHHSDVKANFNAAQRRMAASIRKKIIKRGKITNSDTGETSVTIQIVTVTLLIVDITEDEKKKAEQNETPGIGQIAVFRVVKPDGNFCFVDQTARVYSDWNDYLKNNTLPRTKMCYPENGAYVFCRVPNSSTDTNNNQDQNVLNLEVSESKACTTRERVKAGTMTVVSYLGLAAGVVSLVAAPFTGGAAPGAYVLLASSISGCVGFGCMAVGFLANIGSLYDKLTHDESCYAELGSIAMTLLTVGTSQFNKSILTKVKNGVAVTRAQLVMMTVLNCVKFGVDSIMFVSTLAHMVLKLCREGPKSITPIELLQFSMAAYSFANSVISPKTGYGIIKEAQRRYLVNEKRAKIQDEGAATKYDEFVNESERFGDNTLSQKLKNDWKGVTCSKNVCDELNKNAALIQNINAFSDLNQFFIEVRETNTKLGMTDDGNLMVNEQLEVHGRRLNEIGETVNGVNEHRKKLLTITADYRRATENGPNAVARTQFNEDIVKGGYRYGNDRLFFEVDRKAFVERLQRKGLEKNPLFQNMSVGVADRLWRVTNPLGRQENRLIDAATKVAQANGTTDPRKLADIIEFLNMKRTDIDGNAGRNQFMADMRNPQSAAFQQTVQDWNEAVEAARRVLQTANMPWVSDTSATYHYFKHRGDFPEPAEQQQPQPAPDANVDNREARIQNLMPGMQRYLNEQWAPAIRPENETYSGHSIDGRTFRRSYALNLPHRRTHLAFTSMNADTQTDPQIASHYAPNR